MVRVFFWIMGSIWLICIPQKLAIATEAMS